MRKLLLLAAALLPLSAMAQNIKDYLLEEITTTNESANSKVKANVATNLNLSAIAEEQGDTAYYRDLVRKYQWYEGLGDSLTKAEAYHLPVYFRMTVKNSAGHWQHVEAMCGDSLTTDHDISHYVLDKRYDVQERNKEWQAKLSRVAQWFLTPGLDENIVVEERGYDAKGSMIYGYLPTPNANGRITGCYNDDHGLPVDMGEDSQFTYGSVVYIAMDRCGRDSIIDFLDGKGLPRLNADSVDQQRYKYDHLDRITLSTSNNVVGDPMLDNWGNCGNAFEYDNAHNSCTITTLDANLQPMRMPSLRASGTSTFIRCRITYDEHGRLKEQQMLDARGNPDATLSGISRIVYHYKEHDGRYIATTVAYYDRQGKPIDRQDNPL